MIITGRDCGWPRGSIHATLSAFPFLIMPSLFCKKSLYPEGIKSFYFHISKFSYLNDTQFLDNSKCISWRDCTLEFIKAKNALLLLVRKSVQRLF